MKYLKHWYIYMLGLTFAVVGASMASRDATFQAQMALDKLQAAELAYAPNQETPDVLGAATEPSTATEVTISGKDGASVMQRLQQDHEVIVEHTDEGTLVLGIDGVGASEKERESVKAWRYTLNGKEATMSADRQQTHEGDTIEWKYK